jgi:hypothetical protein
MANFVSGTNRFDYNQFIPPGGGTSGDGIAAGAITIGATAGAALETNANALVYIAQTSLSGNSGEGRLRPWRPASPSPWQRRWRRSSWASAEHSTGRSQGLDTSLAGAASLLWVPARESIRSCCA